MLPTVWATRVCGGEGAGNKERVRSKGPSASGQREQTYSTISAGMKEDTQSGIEKGSLVVCMPKPDRLRV